MPSVDSERDNGIKIVYPSKENRLLMFVSFLFPPRNFGMGSLCRWDVYRDSSHGFVALGDCFERKVGIVLRVVGLPFF